MRFTIGKIPQKVQSLLAIMMLFIMPVVSYVVFEMVAGNFQTNLEKGKLIVALNLFCYYAIYFVIFAVLNSVRRTVLGVNTLLYILAVANAFVVEFREQPIMVMDFKNFGTALTVADSFTYEITSSMILMGIIVLLCDIFVLLVEYRIQRWRGRIACILCVAIVSITGFYRMLAGDFLYQKGIGGLDFFRFNITYKTDGYMFCTVKSLRYLKAEKPENYSAEKVEQIVESFPEEEEKNSELPENVIVIMNEALSDLSVLGEVKVSEPMMPYLNQLNENYAHGNVHVSVLGGGTANSEFEFLTGNSVAYIPAGTVAYQMYVDEDDSSIVDVMKAYDYHTIAFHPYKKTNYNRPKVYEYYGFDEYIAEDDIEKLDRIRKYPSDEADYEKVIEMVENKNDDERLFIFNITMQNHGGYDYKKYESTVSLTGAEGQFPQAEQYLSLLQESDAALEKLISYFSDSDEKTVILLFGDHQPKLEDGFYEMVRG